MPSTDPFEDAANVAQLFDALWYNACSAVLAEGALAAKENRDYDTNNVTRERERAIVKAHTNYKRLTASKE